MEYDWRQTLCEVGLSNADIFSNPDYSGATKHADSIDMSALPARLLN